MPGFRGPAMTWARLHSAELDVAVALDGAELQSLRTAAGLELLWQGDPRFWARRAPHLFPMVGRLPDDRLRHAGRTYRLGQHGFARDRAFQLLEADGGLARFALESDAGTLQQYPFAFRLEVEYRLEAGVLQVGYRVENRSREPLPLSLGAHPAFNWPLRPGDAAEAYRLEFEVPEPVGIRRLQDGLLRLERFPSPVHGRELHLREGLFARDALIFDRLRSRRVTYAGPGGPRLAVVFPDFPQLGVWSRPGAPFVCIEPWQGYAAPQGFAGEFRDKPGVVLIDPEDARHWRYRIEVSA